MDNEDIIRIANTIIEYKDNDRLAPVLIPTCNRYKSLKKCVDSLQANSYADQTELFISVDYPPYQSYYEGYLETCNYIIELSKEHRFKAVNYIFQEHNLGVYKNSLYLKKWVRNKGYSTFIETEDDNTFARCFLDYCNKCLKFYSEDNDVLMICAYQCDKDRKTHIASNAVRENYCRLWGYASWLEKYEENINWINNDNILSFAKNAKKMLGFRKKNEGAFNIFVEGLLMNHVDSFYYKDGKLAFPDFLSCVSMYTNGLFAVFPRENLVYNIGTDGSGLNSRLGDETEDIDNNNPFFGSVENAPIRNSIHVDAQRGIINRLRAQKILLHYITWWLFDRNLA